MPNICTPCQQLFVILILNWVTKNNMVTEGQKSMCCLSVRPLCGRVGYYLLLVLHLHIQSYKVCILPFGVCFVKDIPGVWNGIWLEHAVTS